MESFKQFHDEDGAVCEHILKLLQHLMSREDGKHASFDRVNVDGSNVGAVMNIHNSIPKETSDSCSINLYVSNNIQGVNNSVLVGSEVKMGDPGLGISFGDVWAKKGSKANMSKFPHRKFGLKAVSLCAFVLVASLLVALFKDGNP